MWVFFARHILWHEDTLHTFERAVQSGWNQPLNDEWVWSKSLLVGRESPTKTINV